ncbi:MAG: serine/threonine-protein kinase, partial [Planctomycetota bacterium]
MQVGPYEVIRELGRGGMGIVYLARHTALGRSFALKTLQSGELGTEGAEAHPELVARFVREGRAAARLAGDPGAVAVHDVGEHEGVPYLAMDFVEGGDLRDLIEADDLHLSDALRIMEAVARSVHRAHQLGVLHRDLKPENILIDAEGNPRVTDYGLAKLQELDDASRKLTRTGVLLGTVGYMAPEQLTGAAADARSDVHALGVCLFEVVTGTPPYDGDSTATVLDHVLRRPPRSPRLAGVQISRDLEAVILKALEKEPRHRFQTADELADEIARLRAGEPTLTRPLGVGGRLVRLVGAYPGVALLLLSVAGVGTAAGWFAAGSAEREAAKTEQLEHKAQDTAVAEEKRSAGASYLALLQAVRADLLLLEDAFRGNPDAAAVSADVVERVRRAAAATAEQFAGAPAPTAIVLLAERYAGRHAASDELAVLTSQYPNDPFLRLIHAQARWSEYSEGLRLPGVRIGVSGIAMDRFEEGAKARSMRGRVEEALRTEDSMAALPVELGPWKQWAGAARLLADGQPSEAEAAFAALGDEPLLAHGALLLRGVALLQQGRNAEGALVLERAGERGWAKPLKLAAAARLAEALEPGPSDGVDSAWEQARADYRAVLELQPGDAEARINLAVADVAEAVAHGGSGPQAQEAMRRGLAALGRVVADHPKRADARRLRGGTYLYLGRAAQVAGADPREYYGAALAELRTAMELAPDAWSAYGLGLLEFELASAGAPAGVDPSPGFARALQALESALRDPVAHSPALSVRGLVRMGQAEMELVAKRDASRLLQQAGADFAAAIASAPESPDPYRVRADAARKLADLTEFSGGDPLPILTQAVEDLGKALEFLPDDLLLLSNRAATLMLVGDAHADAG